MADRDTETPTKPKQPHGKGARASIQVEEIPLGDNDAASVLQAAGGARRSASSAEERGASQKFARAIRDPNNKIIATRQLPGALPDGTALGDLYEIPTHEGLTEQEIKRDIAEGRGGKKWTLGKCRE